MLLYMICVVHINGCGLVVPLLAKALPRNNAGQVVHTRLPLFTKQYNLVPGKGW